MAISKPLVLASLFISLLLLHLIFVVEANYDDQKVSTNNGGGSSSVPKINCGVACAARCQLTSRQNLCKRACGTCCARCNCVPPGTSGNQELCPCYYTMTTHGGRRKCP